MAVSLDKTDATLNLSVAEDLLTATPLVTGSLCQLWSGVRANSCVSSGKVFFVVNVVNELSGDCEGVRTEALIGVSARATAVSQLGCDTSLAYASTGQKWTASKAESFGPTYSAGDRIGCFLDMDSEPCTLSFSHNGQWLGHAYELQQSDYSHKALYPHILLKSLAVQLDFTGNGLVAGERWPTQAADYISWQAALETDGVSAPSPMQYCTPADCEVMVMVGLPGCGKSTWAARYVANHPERRYVSLSIDGVLKQMKPGSSQLRGKQKPPDAKTQQLAEQAYKELLDHIEDVPRNYVLDDSNVYEGARSARVGKLKKAGYKTRAAVIVLPDSSLFRRQRKQHQEEGKTVPETTIADMRANFSMPEVGDVFQEVFFVEAKPPEAHDIAAAQAEAAKAALPVLKARSAGGRQTRSRTSKATPAKRASVSSKKDADEKKGEAGTTAPVPNGSPAAAAIASEALETSGKPVNSSAAANSDVKVTAADSVMADVSQTEAADNDQISTEVTASPKPETDAAASTVDKNQQSTEDTDQADATTSMDVDADKAAPEPASLSAAAQEAAEAPADEVMEAAPGVEPSQHAANQQGSVLSQEEGQEAAPPKTDPEKEDEAQAKPEEPNEAEAEEVAQADPGEAAKEQAEAGEAGGNNSMADADVRMDELKEELAASMAKSEPQTDVVSKAKSETKAQPEEQTVKAEVERQAEKAEPEVQAGKAEPERQAEKAEPKEEAGKAEPAQKAGPVHKAEPQAEAALKQRSPAGPVSSAQGSAERDSRGVKRPAPAIARGAKQARTNQAAGRLLGTIRQQGTVKRTVIRGRVGARPAGMRLPPPMATQGTAPVQAPAASAAAEAKDDAKDNSETAAQEDDKELLPAEQEPKPTPPKADTIPQTPKDSSEKQDAKQPPARLLHCQGYHSQEARPGITTKCRQLLSRRAVQGAPQQRLVAANTKAGIDKALGTIIWVPGMQEDQVSAAPRGYPRNAGQAAGSRHGPYPPQGGRPGRAPAETQRPAPSWGRNAPPAREAPAPARLRPPAARRALAPERSAPAARAPRSDFGGSQRAPNSRAPARAPAPDRGAAASASGFPVGRQRPFAPPGGARASIGTPHSGPPRGRADRPAPAPRVSNAAFIPQPERFDAPVPASRGVNRSEAGRYGDPPARYSNALLPPPRLGPMPAAGPPGLAGDDYTPRGVRREPSSHVDRPRSRSRGPPSSQRAPIYSERATPRGRQPAAQQLRSATYPQEQLLPQHYHAADAGPIHAPHYDPQHAGGYAPDPLPARRGDPNRAPMGGDGYGAGPAARGSSQQWQGKPAQALDAHPAPEYHQPREPVGRDSFGRQSYAAQQRGPDVHMSDARLVQTDRRMDRRGRGSRDRADVRRQRFDDPVDNGRYAQGSMDQVYAHGPATDGYNLRDAPPLSRSHGYSEDPRGPDSAYTPPQHVQTVPPRYDSPMGGYAPPVAQDPHQPVYGSGPVAPQGYTTAAPQVERQPYYPQQQQPTRQAPAQQQYAEPSPQYAREPVYSAGPGTFAGGSQGGYIDGPPVQAARGGYAQNATATAPRHRGEEYDPAYLGPSRAQGYSGQVRPSLNAPIVRGGVSHEAHVPRGGPRGSAPSQQWAPSPREQSYSAAPHGSGNFGGQPSQRQGGYSSAPGSWSGNSTRAPQDVYPPQQQMGNGRVHAPQGGYGR
ncbi:hypothetical protein WJX79_010159 [Trebouxia sp. C0005]